MNAEQRTMEIDGKTYRRYAQKAFLRGEPHGPTIFFDWFTDDEQAAKESQGQMEAQGYHVSRVEVIGAEVRVHLGEHDA